MAKRVVNIGKGTGQDQFVRVEDKSGCVKFNEFMQNQISATKKLINLAGGGIDFREGKGTGQRAADDWLNKHGADTGSGTGGATGAGTKVGGVQGVKGVEPAKIHHCQNFFDIMRKLLKQLDKLVHPKAKRVPKERSPEYIEAHKAALEEQKKIDELIGIRNELIRKGLWNPYIHAADFRGGIEELTEIEKELGFGAGTALLISALDFETIELFLLLPF